MQNAKEQFIKERKAPKTVFKKGNAPPKHKPECKCFRCSKTGFNGIHSMESKKKMSEIRKGKPLKHSGQFKKGETVGDKNNRWNNGKYLSKGYLYIFKPNHPYANKMGYILESHLIMEKYIKRFLTSKEIVHHKGTKYPINSIENKQDNRIENLQLFKNKSEHTKFHWLIIAPK